jgi:hypothetical protein
MQGMNKTITRLKMKIVHQCKNKKMYIMLNIDKNGWISKLRDNAENCIIIK